MDIMDDFKKEKTYLYKCVINKNANNGLLKRCTFEQRLPEGTHHCPCCGGFLKKKEEQWIRVQSTT